MSSIDAFAPLAAAGDLRGLKRLYAQLLRQTRPDEDPIGFQHLQEAFERARHACEARLAAPGTNDDAPASLPAGEAQTLAFDAAPLTATTPERSAAAVDLVQRVQVDAPMQFDPQAACQRLLDVADTQLFDARLERELKKEMLDWPVWGRDQVSDVLWTALNEREIACARDGLTLITDLLGWSDVRTGVNPGMVHYLIEQAHGRWLQQPRQHAALGRLLGTSVDAKDAAKALRRLQQPASRLRNLLSALTNARVTQQLHLLELLGWRPGWPLPHGVDRGQADFWLQRRTFNSWVNIQILLLRFGTASAVLLAMFVVGGALSTPARLPTTDNLMFAVMPLLLWAAITLYNTVLDWQCRADTPEEKHPHLRRWFLPLSLLAASPLVLVGYPTPSGGQLLVAWVLGGALVRVAWMRAGIRRGTLLPFNIGIAVLVIPAVLSVIATPLVVLTYWGLDLWYQRRSTRT